MVLGFGDPTKGMTRIWGHFVILDVCECVILRPQIMLSIVSIYTYDQAAVQIMNLLYTNLMYHYGNYTTY